MSLRREGGENPVHSDQQPKRRDNAAESGPGYPDQGGTTRTTATFAEWITTLRAHDNPRGDCIRDSLDLVRAKGFVEPEEFIAWSWAHGCREARIELELLVKRYLRVIR